MHFVRFAKDPTSDNNNNNCFYTRHKSWNFEVGVSRLCQRQCSDGAYFIRPGIMKSKVTLDQILTKNVNTGEISLSFFVFFLPAHLVTITMIYVLGSSRGSIPPFRKHVILSTLWRWKTKLNLALFEHTNTANHFIC